MANTAQAKRVAAKHPVEPAAPLSPERAFVVQLEGDRHGFGRRLAGRVEHLESGEARRFASIEDLSAFLSRFPDRRGCSSSRSRRPTRGGRQPASSSKGDA